MGPAAEIRPEQFESIDDLRSAWAGHEARTRTWLATLTQSDLDAPTSVNGLDGRSRATYLLHVVEHGVTEFAVAAAQLHELGHEVGDLSVLRMLAEG